MNDAEFDILLFTRLLEYYGPHEPIAPKFHYVCAILDGFKAGSLRFGVVSTKAFQRLNHWI